MSERPIGAFDSGVGGLSIVRALVSALPHEAIHYVADSAHCPYGARTTEEIVTFSMGISRYLVQEGAKLIVVACNTASAAALHTLRATFPEVPFVGMVPAVKPAAALTRSGAVGVLATPTTINGRLYHDVVEHHAEGVRVLSTVAPGLVERIEEGDLDGPATRALLWASVRPLIEAGADVLVLGCTHYPFVAPVLKQMLPPQVRLMEPSEAIARQTARVLRERGLLRPPGVPPRHVYATSGSTTALAAALSRFLDTSAPVLGLEWTNGRLRAAGPAPAEP